MRICSSRRNTSFDKSAALFLWPPKSPDSWLISRRVIVSLNAIPLAEIAPLPDAISLIRAAAGLLAAAIMQAGRHARYNV